MDCELVQLDTDDDSIIYVSDNSITEIETVKNPKKNRSVESILLESSSSEEEEEEDASDDDMKDVLLQEEKFTVMETVEETSKETAKQYTDKTTQTYDNEFSTNCPNRAAVLANTSQPITTNVFRSIRAPTSGSNQPAPEASGSVPASIATLSSNSTSANATNQNDMGNENFNNRNSARQTSPVRNNVTQTRRTYSHTKTYRNYRVQPYRRYNNNYNRFNNKNYGTNYNSNNYYNRNNNYGYNWHDVGYNYNNNYRYNHYINVQRYGNRYFTNQFKERLFRGFINLMDFVFDYSQDLRY